MGIVRIVEWKLKCSPGEADAQIRGALASVGADPKGPPSAIQGYVKRALLKNRWAAHITVEISPETAGSRAVWRIDMLGNKHYSLLSDIVENVGDDLIDDHNIGAAVERLGKLSRLFGRKEIRHLKNLLHADETVHELGHGIYGDKHGLVVLTNFRLFFFEKSIGNETIDEFPMEQISALSTRKARTGETLRVSSSGGDAEIRSMMHGQADAFTRTFRNVRNAVSEHVRETSTDHFDLVNQIEGLARLRDQGVLSSEEFESKKTELLKRM